MKHEKTVYVVETMDLRTPVEFRKFYPTVYDARHETLAQATERASRFGVVYDWRIVEEVTTSRIVATKAGA